MWLLHALGEAIVAALITVVRGWAALLTRPLQSMRVIAALPRNLELISKEARDLFGPGLAVRTPPGDAPMLRTVVFGFGDLTTTLAGDFVPSQTVLTRHFNAVRQQLGPLTATAEALLRVSLLGVAMLAVVRKRHAVLCGTDLANLAPVLGNAFHLVGSAFLISFMGALVVRFVVLLLRRGIRRWIERALGQKQG